MKEKYEIKTIHAGNVDETGFFCYMSKRKEPGFKQKRDWLDARFAEGMKIKVIHETGGRDTAFIEYIPGEFAWRAVHAKGYMFIHCLWVVGKGKGKGYGSLLIQECIKDARAQKMKGVAMLTSDHTWLVGREIFERNGFVEMDSAPPSFQLMVTRFGSGLEAALPSDWDKRAQAFGHGLTVIRTPQCPYIENGTNDILSFAKARGIKAKVVELKTAKEVQERSPFAYGVFGTVLDGKPLAYQYLLERDFDKLLQERGRGG
ncbi:MAG: GNAT family N-acetyltransferase [Chloroflexi bacterium]|nr:GNAT family N-acetyltransferase [Chloroflexota bacterium]